MKNLINWTCLLSVMFLVFQVMYYITIDIINQFNQIKTNKNKKKYTSTIVGKSKVRAKGVCYSEKIAK